MSSNNVVQLRRENGARNNAQSIAQDIVRAKQDWETSIDRLPLLVCVLGRDGSVLRTNKTLETWGLGLVRSVGGKSLHDALHGQACSRHCRLRSLWRKASAVVARGEIFRTTLRRLGERGPMLLEMVPATDTAEHVGVRVNAVLTLSDGAPGQFLTRRLKRAESTLRKSEDKLRRLTGDLGNLQDVERHRIARDLHDGLGPTLSAIKLFAYAALEAAPENERNANYGALRFIATKMDETISEVSRIAMALRPTALDSLGVVASLSVFLHEIETVCGGIRFDKELSIDEKDVPHTLKTIIYRVTQESVHNILKHSQADRACVLLRKKGTAIELVVSDNGIGFDAATVSARRSADTRLGLASMRHRVALSGGSYSIDSRPGKGTVLTAVWRRRRASA